MSASTPKRRQSLAPDSIQLLRVQKHPPSTLTLLYKTKTSTGGAYLIDPDEQDDAGHPLLFGKPVYLSPSMPATTSGLKPVIFGDLSYFVMREVANSLTVKTFHERYAEYAEIGYEGYWRISFALEKGAVAPVPAKFLQMA